MRPYEPPRSATAQRPTWDDLPADVRSLVEGRLGAVTQAWSQGAGYTPGFASRLTTVEGRAFVKAIDRGTAQVHSSYRREAEVNAALPLDLPRPRLLWTDEGGDWLVLCFEDVEGHTPHRPWRPDQLHQVLDVLVPIAELLTPPPDLAGLETTADLDATFASWRSGTAPPDGWQTRTDLLVELESEWAPRAAGSTAVHFDLRDDNVLLNARGPVVCDWNWLAVTAPWTDLVGLLVSAHAEGHDADALLVGHPLGREAEPRSVDAFLAMLAGYYTAQALLPCPATSPWMRVHQAWWRDATLGWLEERLRLRR